jgi:hypothetical protein
VLRRARGRCTTPRAWTPGFEPAGTLGCSRYVSFSRRIDTSGMVRSCAWRGGDQERAVTRAAGPVAPCSVLGREVVVAGTAEAPWEVPWRSLFLVGGFL